MADCTAKRIKDMEAGFGGGFVKARAELGVSAFGMQVEQFPPNFLHHPEHGPARRDDREVAKAPIEHLEQHLAPEPVGPDRVGGIRHRRRYRILPGQTVRDHARAQVAVGENPERAVCLAHHHRTL